MSGGFAFLRMNWGKNVIFCYYMRKNFCILFSCTNLSSFLHATVMPAQLRCKTRRHQWETGCKAVHTWWHMCKLTWNIRGRFFVHFFRGKLKFSPNNVGKKLNFPRKKVLKNHFSKKFRGLFRGKWFSAEKNVRKIGPSPCLPTFMSAIFKRQFYILKRQF
jgi:hypothetical protein